MHKVLGVVAPMRYDSGPHIMTCIMTRIMTCVMTRIITLRHDVMTHIMICVMTLSMCEL